MNSKISRLRLCLRLCLRPSENQALVRLIQMPKNNFKLAAIYEEGLLRWENIRFRNMLDHPLAWD